MSRVTNLLRALAVLVIVGSVVAPAYADDVAEPQAPRAPVEDWRAGLP